MSQSHSHDASGNIKAAFFLNLAFTLLEIIGGIWTNSLAILSDSIHDLGDSLSLGLAWYLDRFSKKGMDQKFSYGYRRFSLLGALINAIILIIGSLFILVKAIPRLIDPEPSNAQGMILFSIVGILANGLAFIRLKDAKTLNAKVIAWHLIEDVLGWVAVLVVSIALLFSDIQILDPILSILITLYVSYNVIANLKKTLAFFMQAVPESINISDIDRRLQIIEKVRSTHYTHIWSLDGEHNVLTTHVVVD
jgi:cobalt-zinc-cadmium efflux system protein